MEQQQQQSIPAQQIKSNEQLKEVSEIKAKRNGLSCALQTNEAIVTSSTSRTLFIKASY